MPFVNGNLGLGTALVSGVIVEPVSGLAYSRVPISFDSIVGGVTLNVVNGVFGPVSGTWGTLSLFQLFDQYGNPGWAGTLQAPITPVAGQLVYIPVGSISLSVNAQVPASGAVSGLQSIINVPPGAVLGNAGSGVQGPQTLYVTSGLGVSSGAVAGSGLLFTTPATTGLLGTVSVPVTGNLSVGASGALSFTSGTLLTMLTSGMLAAAITPSVMQSLLTSWAVSAATTDPGPNIPWLNSGFMVFGP